MTKDFPLSSGMVTVPGVNSSVISQGPHQQLCPPSLLTLPSNLSFQPSITLPQSLNLTMAATFRSLALFFHLPSQCRVPVRGASSSPEPDAVAGVCGSRAVCPALSKQGAFSVCCCKNRGTVYLGTQAFPPSTGQ